MASILMKEVRTVFMNKFCVFSKNKETFFIKRLIEEVGQDAVKLFDPWSDFELPEAQCYLSRTTGVNHSDMDLLIMSSLPADKLVNPLNVLKRFRSKPTQYQWMEENGFDCLPWLNLKTETELNVEKLFRLYPRMIVKPLVGQGGWGVEALTFEEWKRWWKKKCQSGDKDYLVQRMIYDGQEYRYFFIKDQSPIVLERTNKTGVAANFQREGEAKLSSLPTEHMAEVEKLIRASGASYGAVDLIIKDGILYILELNTVPGIEQLEKVSGENIIQRLLTILPA